MTLSIFPKGDIPYLVSLKKNKLNTNTMKRIFVFALMLMGISLISKAQYADYFTNATMRLDYNHVGNSGEEHFAFDQMVNDGEWAGSKTVLIDELKLGKYFFEVKDPKSGKTLYSRGFSSIYGEWETTGEARSQWGSFHESLRFPWPKNIQTHKKAINCRLNAGIIFMVFI